MKKGRSSSSSEQDDGSSGLDRGEIEGPIHPVQKEGTLRIATKDLQCLKCAVCHEVLWNTVLVMDCGHRFCSKCIERCLRNTVETKRGRHSCPICRVYISSRRRLRKDKVFDDLIRKIYAGQQTPGESAGVADETAVVAYMKAAAEGIEYQKQMAKEPGQAHAKKGAKTALSNGNTTRNGRSENTINGVNSRSEPRKLSTAKSSQVLKKISGNKRKREPPDATKRQYPWISHKERRGLILRKHPRDNSVPPLDVSTR